MNGYAVFTIKSDSPVPFIGSAVYQYTVPQPDVRLYLKNDCGRGSDKHPSD
jgi:hypothetical protein